MNYPAFFDDIESIKVQDMLSDMLGVFEEGIYEFKYIDAVKSAGHSCPTVAGGYLMTLEGLNCLYLNELPVRGDIKVEFKESMVDGAVGVVANVVSQITGATSEGGFKGINGQFARNTLMSYEADIDSSVRLTRIDTGKAVDIYYDPSVIKPDQQMQLLKQKMQHGLATKDDVEQFGILWQDRVKRIFQSPKEVLELKIV